MAAEVLLYSQPGYIDRNGVGADALDKEMDKLRARSNETILQGARFIRTATPRGGVYKEADYGTGLELPRKSEDTDQMPFVTPVPGFDVSISVVNFRLAIQVEQSMIEDQIHPVVKKMMSGLLRSGKLNIEYGIADKMNNLTSTDAAYVGADGVAVASSTHPFARRETGTWSNLESATALTTTNLFTAMKNLRNRTDEFGYKKVIMTRQLVGPVDLLKKMAEIKESKLIPENALNTANTQTDWTWSVYDYLTDTNAWFLLGDRPADENGLIFVQKVAPNIKPLEGRDKATDIKWGTRLRMRVGFGVHIWDNLQYNQGA